MKLPSQLEVFVTNFAYTFGRLGGEVVIGLLLTPLLIRALGLELFGLLVTIAASGLLMTVAMRTMQQSIARELGYRLGQGDALRVKQAFSSALALQLMLSVLILLAGFALVPVLLGVLDIPPQFVGQTKICLLMTFAQLSVTVLGSPYAGMLRAHQDLKVISVVELLTKIASLLGAVAILLVQEYQLVIYVGVQFATIVLVNGFYAALARSRYPEATLRTDCVRWDSSKAILSYGSLAFVNVVGTQLRKNGISIFLNIGFGNVVTAAHGIAVRLSFLIAQVALAVRTVILPAMTLKAGAGDASKSERLVCIASSLAFSIAMPIALPILTDTNALLSFWLRIDLPPLAILFTQLLVLSLLVTTLSQGHSLALHADGRIGVLVIVGQSLVIVSVCSAAFATQMLTLAPETVLIGELVGVFLVSAIWQPSWVRKMLFKDNRAWRRHALLPILASLISCGLVALSIQSLLPSSILRAILIGGAAAVVCMAIFFWVTLLPSERKDIVRLLSKRTLALRRSIRSE